MMTRPMEDREGALTAVYVTRMRCVRDLFLCCVRAYLGSVCVCAGVLCTSEATLTPQSAPCPTRTDTQPRSHGHCCARTHTRHTRLTLRTVQITVGPQPDSVYVCRL